MRYGGLVVAAVLAAIAALVVFRMSPTQQTPQTQAALPVKGIKVYVAAQNIPVGSAITAEMVAQQDWPEHLALPGFMKVDDKEAPPIVGMVARSPFQQNEPFISNKLTNPNDPNFLAGDLPKGMRIVTIPINEVDGIAGFVFPGDRVDILYTHDTYHWVSAPTANSIGGLNQNNVEKQKSTVTETLLTNVKVLAVDQRASSIGSPDKNGNLVIPRSASVMVSQVDAQRVRLAQKTGSLSLALRSMADRDASDPLVLTSKKDISLEGGDSTASSGAVDSGVKVVRGAPRNLREIESGGAAVSRSAPPVSNPGS